MLRSGPRQKRVLQNSRIGGGQIVPAPLPRPGEGGFCTHGRPDRARARGSLTLADTLQDWPPRPDYPSKLRWKRIQRRAVSATRAATATPVGRAVRVVHPSSDGGFLGGFTRYGWPGELRRKTPASRMYTSSPTRRRRTRAKHKRMGSLFSWTGDGYGPECGRRLRRRRWRRRRPHRPERQRRDVHGHGVG